MQKLGPSRADAEYVGQIMLSSVTVTIMVSLEIIVESCKEATARGYIILHSF